MGGSRLGHRGAGELMPFFSPFFVLVSEAREREPMLIGTQGWYNFTFDAKTSDGRRIYCITTEVCLRFKREKDNEGYPPGPWTNCTWPR